MTNKEKYTKDFYKIIGHAGGTRGRTGGFYVHRDLARTAGAKGGRVSRRYSSDSPERIRANREKAKRRRELEKAYKHLTSVHKQSMREKGSHKFLAQTA